MPHAPVEGTLKHKNLTLRNFINLLYSHDKYIDPETNIEY